jgi:hypothetical protein
MSDESLYSYFGEGKHYDTQISLDLRKAPMNCDTYTAWLHCWLKAHCTDKFTVEIYGYPVYHTQSRISIWFKNPSDACYFRLKNKNLPVLPAE